MVYTGFLHELHMLSILGTHTRMCSDVLQYPGRNHYKHMKDMTSDSERLLFWLRESFEFTEDAEDTERMPINYLTTPLCVYRSGSESSILSRLLSETNGAPWFGSMQKQCKNFLNLATYYSNIVKTLEFEDIKNLLLLNTGQEPLVTG